MGISEAERRVEELSSLINGQLRLIRNLEKRGKDLTSAKIVFDSLRVSLFLATQDWHRARCYSEPGPVGKDVNAKSLPSDIKPSLVVLSRGGRHMARWSGGDSLMKAEENLIEKNGTKDNKEPFDPSILRETGVEQQDEPSRRCFEFRPLSEQEKKEFANSLNADGRRILAELADRAKRSGKSAA